MQVILKILVAVHRMDIFYYHATMLVGWYVGITPQKMATSINVLCINGSNSTIGSPPLPINY